MAVFKSKKLAKNVQEEKRHTILLVDDEAFLLEALNSILSPYYNILMAPDGEDALGLIQKKENLDNIHLIISDQRMPKMGGAEFLIHAKSILPNAVRILLTGYSDMEAIVQAINSGQIYKFIHKPVEKNDLLTTVKIALESYNLINKNLSLTSRLKDINEGLENVIVERTKCLKESNSQLVQEREKLEEANQKLKEANQKLVHQAEEIEIMNQKLIHQAEEIEIMNQKLEEREKTKLTK